MDPIYPGEFLSIYLSIYKTKRWGIRHIETGAWFTYTDRKGEVRPFISDLSLDCKEQLKRLQIEGYSNPADFWEVVEMSDVEMRDLSELLDRMNNAVSIHTLDEY